MIDFKNTIVTVCCALTATMASAQAEPLPVPAKDVTTVTLTQHYPLSAKMGAFQSDTMNIVWSFILNPTDRTATLTHPVADPEATDDSYRLNGRYHFEKYSGDANGGPYTSYTRNFYALWTPMIDRDYHHLDPDSPLRNDSWMMSAIRVPSTFEHEGQTYTVTAIGDSAFAGSNIVTVHVPSTVTSIGDYAFADCVDFAGLPDAASAYEVVPGSVTSLGRGVFKGCTTMDRMSIGDGVRVLPEETFDGCTNMKRLTLGRNVERISCLIPPRLYRIAFKGARKPEMLKDGFESQTSVWVDERHADAFPASWNANTYSIVPERESLIFYKGHFHPVNFTMTSANEWTNTQVHHMFGYPGINYGGGIEPYREVTLVFAHNQFAGDKQSNDLIAPPYRVDFSDDAAYLFAEGLEYHRDTRKGTFKIAMRTLGDQSVTVTGVDATEASYTWPVKVIEGVPVTKITIDGPLTVEIGGTTMKYTASCIYEGSADSQQPLVPSRTDVLWSCDTPDILTIDADGTVHPLKAGFATIRATSADPACYSVAAILTVRVDDGNAVKYTVKQTVPTAPYTVSMNGNNIDAKSIKKRTVSTDFYYFFNSDGTAEITYPGANRHDTFDNNEQIPATPYEFDFPGHEPVRTVKADGTLGDFCFYTSTITNFLLRHSSTTTNYLEAFRSSLYIETMPYTAVENPDGIQQATLYRANRIGNHAFAGSNIRYISFYDDFEAQLKRPQIEEIGDYAFLNCKEFRGIFPGSHDRVVPKTVKKIGRGVFKGCEKMSSMIIGDSVEVIPEETFDGCTSLTRLTLGKSVKEVNCAIKCDTIIIRSAKVPAFNRGVTANTLTTAPVVYYIEGNEAPEAGAGKTFSEANALHFNVSPEEMYLFTNTTGRADVDIKSISDPDRQWGTGIAGHYPYPKVNGITFNRYADKDKAPGWTPVITGEWPSDARAIGPNIAGGNFDTYTSIKFLTPSPNNGAKPFSILLRANDGSEQEITLPVHVKEGKKVTGISLISNKGNFVKPGDQCILTVIRQPGNINDQDHTSYRDKYQFTSSDESVATVAPVGVVTAHKVGNVTITCRLNDPYSGYPEATFELSVRKEGTAIPSRTWKYHFPVKDGDIVMGNITRTAADFSFLPIEAPEGEIPGAMITFPGATQERIAELIGNNGATLPRPNETDNTPYTFAYPGYTNRQLVAPHLATTVTRKVSEWIETLKNPSGQYYKSTYRFQLDVPATIEVGDSKYAVRAISAGAFANSNIAHIDIPEGVEEIGDYAFAEAKDFVGIETNAHNTIIPNTVKKIGKGLFRGCTAMTSMIIGDGVEVIPEATFDGCNNLKSVGIGKNVKEINCDIKLISTDSKDYTILAFQSKEPPTLKEGCIIEATNVKVPEGSEEAYKKAFPHLAARMKSFKLSFTEKDKKLTAYAGQRIPLKYSIQELPTDAVTFDFIYPAEPGSPTSPPFNGTVSGSSVGVGGETGRRFTIEYSDLDEVLAGNIIAHSNISIDVKYKNVGEHQVILTWLDVTRASDTITVSTVEGVPVERIIISAPPSIRPGATATATARLLGYNGMTPTNPKIHWQSLNPDVLEIDHETGEFKGLKTGKATIVCYSDDPLSGVDEEATIEVCELIQTVKLMAVDDEGNELFEIKPLGAPGTTSDDDCGIYEWTGNKVRLKRVLYPEGVLEPALSEQTWSSTCEAENPTFATNFTTTGDDAQPAYDPENMVIDCLHGYAPGDREDYEYELLVLNIKGIRMLDGNDFTARYPIRVKTEMKDIDIEVPQPPAPDLPGADEEHTLVVDDEHTDRIELNVRIDKDATDRYVKWEVEDEELVSLAALDDDGNEVDPNPQPEPDPEPDPDPDPDPEFPDLPGIASTYSVKASTARMTASTAATSAVDSDDKIDCRAVIRIKQKQGKTVVRAYDPEGRGAEYRLTVDVRRLAKAMEINTLSIVGAVGFVGGRMNVNATIAPDDATINLNELVAAKRLTMTSSDESVATINELGQVCFVGAGRAMITVSVADGSNVSKTFSVRVTPVRTIQLSVTPRQHSGLPGSTVALAPVFKPQNATDKRVAWASDNESVATVDAYGNVTLAKLGNAIITCTAIDGSNARGTASIHVVENAGEEQPDDPDDPDNPDNPDNPEEWGDPEFPDLPSGIDGVGDDSDGDNVEVTTDGTDIIVSGLAAGRQVRVYTIEGRLLTSVRSTGATVKIKADPTRIYLVLTPQPHKVKI